jgi:hypothetical protein
MTAAAAVIAANHAKTATTGNEKAGDNNKAARNLSKLKSISRPILVGTPQDRPKMEYDGFQR